MRRFLVITAIIAFGPSTAWSQDHAVGARFGLLGIGAEYAYRFTDRIAFRAGFNGSGFSFEEEESGIDYDFDLDFDSLSLGVDVHPMRGAFRVSAGYLRNDTGLSAASVPTGILTIGDTTYPASLVGTLRGRIGFDSTAPFFGLGFDWLREKRVGLTFDLGVVDQGAPQVALTADGPIASEPGFAADLAAERAELQESLDDFDVYPYAMLGFVVRF